MITHEQEFSLGLSLGICGMKVRSGNVLQLSFHGQGDFKMQDLKGKGSKSIQIQSLQSTLVTPFCAPE
jgi:hypothetical protein